MQPLCDFQWFAKCSSCSLPQNLSSYDSNDYYPWLSTFVFVILANWFSLATKALQKVKAKYLGLLIRPAQNGSSTATVSFPFLLHPLIPVRRPADWTEGQRADRCQNSEDSISPSSPFSPTIPLMCVHSGPPRENILLPATICSASTVYEKIKNMWQIPTRLMNQSPGVVAL